MAQELIDRRKALRNSCQEIHGSGTPDAAAEMVRTAAWCQENGVEQDVYGGGKLVEGFEAKIASLFGHERARFLPSGTMAQGIALRIWCGAGGHFGMHPSSHVEIHEERGYSHLLGLRATLVGDFDREMLPKHLAAVQEPLSALLMELPSRENGGRLPSWEELLELCALAKERGIRLHLDGARVWQAQVAYGRSFAEIGALFDSIYVSFYKDIGALSGAMLIGNGGFIDEAKLWQRRMGGTLYTLLPNIASAASRFDDQIAKLPGYREKAIELAQALSPIQGLQVLPDPPQTSMMHIVLNLDPDAALAARDRVAEETGLWLFGGGRPGPLPGFSRFELTVGEAAMQVSMEKVAAGFASLFNHG
jgi:threonine aldolase